MPKPPAVWVSVPALVAEIPRMKGPPLAFSIPEVKLRLPDTVPVLGPFNKALPEMVTPAAFEFCMVKPLKLAVGEAVRLRKVPVPLMVWAFVEGDCVPPTKLAIISVVVPVRVAPAPTEMFPFTYKTLTCLYSPEVTVRFPATP